MNLFILRHGVAVDRDATRYPNDDRPLTTVGKQKMEKEAASFPSLLGKIDVIISSPLSRAKETAEIVAKTVRTIKKVRCSDALLPGGSLEALLSLLKGEGEKNLLIVGHEPDLSRLEVILIGGEGGNIALKKGGLCLITFSGSVERGAGTLRYLLLPKQLRSFHSRKSHH